MSRPQEPEPPLRIVPPREPLDPDTRHRLRETLEGCSDVAFAHLAGVAVDSQESEPELVLFVWLEPAAIHRVRPALNLVSEVVAACLPRGRHLDVVILNSAPELLEAVERGGELVVERDPVERAQALEAASCPSEDSQPEPKRPWWWPF